MATTNLSAYDKESIPKIPGAKFGIVVAEWNNEITEGLYQGCLETLLDCGIPKSAIIRKDVPGSFELPLGAQFFFEHTDVDAVICLGSVIQGETKHFDFVCNAATIGIKNVGLKYNAPVVFGVLTDNTYEQARARSGGDKGNKGTEAAITAIKMVALAQSFS